MTTYIWILSRSLSRVSPLPQRHNQSYDVISHLLSIQNASHNNNNDYDNDDNDGDICLRSCPPRRAVSAHHCGAFGAVRWCGGS